jgi:5S rRNA maturation endonuclease (ribonuclease M5)
LIEAVEAKETIFVCEGEKDVEAIRATGNYATCNPMGAGKWRDEYDDFFHGAYVVIVQDRDEPGRAHARRVKESLDRVAEQVWIVQAKVGKDAADHLAAGYSPGEFVPDRPRTERGVYSAPVLVEQAIERLSLKEADVPSYDPLAALSRHLGFLPGRLYLAGGYTGDGKTALALQITRGLCESGVRVGYFSLEMTNIDLLNRLLEHKGIPLRALERPWEIVGSQYETTFRSSLREIKTWGLDIMFQPGTNADYIVQQTKDGEYDFVIIDHVHRFSWGNERRKLEEELGKITNLALDHNIPVLVLAQLRRFTRGPGMEAYPRPILQDFRETEAFGNEAARAMAVWRRRKPGGVEYEGDGASEIIVLKDRYNALSTSIVWFDGERQLFVTTPPNQSDPPSEEIHPVWGQVNE